MRVTSHEFRDYCGNINSQLNEIYVLNHELGRLANQRLERFMSQTTLSRLPNFVIKELYKYLVDAR